MEGQVVVVGLVAAGVVVLVADMAVVLELDLVEVLVGELDMESLKHMRPKPNHNIHEANYITSY